MMVLQLCATARTSAPRVRSEYWLHGRSFLSLWMPRESTFDIWLVLLGNHALTPTWAEEVPIRNWWC